ncbi:MAG: sialate O-acetylesterase [Bacteroidia bacterium]|nr:sialate O-acetylesterase [Bacteroidia bacterium]
MKNLTLIVYLILAVTSLKAQLRLPAIYDDHMVIQQQSSAPIWGWARSTQEITIKVSWDTTTIKAKTDNTAFWSSSLQTPIAGGPHTITIKAGEEERILQDVMSGEVWICSGQSNMEWSMAASADGRELLTQIDDRNIRLFNVGKSAAPSLQVRGEGDWQICDKESVRDFSAVGYFFGKKLLQDLNVPIGLINVSWGGTPAEVWLPEERIKANSDLAKSSEKQIDNKPWCPSKPGVVFNAMINPLIPFRIAGALWYQGESNTAAPSTYKLLMENLILEWRKQFLVEFPFYYVQIAPFSGYGEIEIGTLIREQQVKMLEIPKTGMVVISDLVEDVKDIHPKYKKPVGERLANLALAKTYGKNEIVSESPIYRSMRVEKKGKIRISFDHVPSELIAKGVEPNEFLIAGEDQKFYSAKARIEKNTVTVWAKEVKHPIAVRFGWKNGSIPNLFSKEGLPVSCFRTDEWPTGK